MRLRPARWRRVCLLPLLLLLGGCANEVTDTLIEQPLGKLSEWAVNMSFRMDRDPLLHGFTDRIGQEHRRFVKRKNVPYRFSVVELEEPNAFAIPWGGIYVTKGLLRFSDSEDEVAFVVGHEIGHVERRHSSLAFQRNLIVNIALALLTTRKNQDWMEFAYIGNALLDLHWSRENEYAADRHGALYTFDGGRDPYSGLDFFRKLDQRFGATPRFFSYLQTHPINRDRITAVRQTPQLAQDGPTLAAIADGYRLRGMHRSAEGYFFKAVTADPNYGPAYVGLARVATWRGDIKTARQRYQEALSHGAEAEVVNAELAALANAPAEPPAPVVTPASTQDAVILTEALSKQGEGMAKVAQIGRTVWQEPLAASAGLVTGHNAAGTHLDQLYRLSDALPKAFQQAVLGGQRLRGVAMRDASAVSAAGDEARLTVETVNRNRERLLAKLKAAPTPDTVALARRVLAEHELAGRDVRSGVQRLNEVVPEMRTAVKQSHQAIERVRQAAAAGQRTDSVAKQLTDDLEAAQYRADKALDRAQPGVQEVFDGRVRSIESSIDISMLDRHPNERAAAAQIIARFMLAAPADVDVALGNGMSYGEAAYVLGMARSANRPVKDVVDQVKPAGARTAIENLGHRRVGRSENVAVMLKLVDHALRAQFDPS